MNSQRTLWMGDIDFWMNEDYIRQIYKNLNFNIKNIKIIKDKVTGHPQGYCFLEFENPEDAKQVLENFNGKPIGNLGKVFKLNWAMYNSFRIGAPTNSFHSSGRSSNKTLKSTTHVSNHLPHENSNEEYSMFVGDIDPLVKDETLREIFQRNYSSVSYAKVIFDSVSKRSKCYGFVNFKNQQEFERALFEMNGVVIYNRAIKVNRANKKFSYENSQSSETSKENCQSGSPIYKIKSPPSNVHQSNTFNVSNFSLTNSNSYPNLNLKQNPNIPQYIPTNDYLNYNSNQNSFNSANNFPINSPNNYNLFNYYYNFYIQNNVTTTPNILPFNDESYDKISSSKINSQYSQTDQDYSSSIFRKNNYIIKNSQLSHQDSNSPSKQQKKTQMNQFAYYCNYLISFNSNESDKEEESKDLHIHYSKYGHDDSGDSGITELSDNQDIRNSKNSYSESTNGQVVNSQINSPISEENNIL